MGTKCIRYFGYLTKMSKVCLHLQIRKYSLCNIRENLLGPVYNKIIKLLVVLVISLFCWNPSGSLWALRLINMKEGQITQVARTWAVCKSYVSITDVLANVNVHSSSFQNNIPKESIQVGCVPPICADGTCFNSHQILALVGEGGSYWLNKFEQVSSEGHQMSLAGVPCGGVGQRWGGGWTVRFNLPWVMITWDPLNRTCENCP